MQISEKSTIQIGLVLTVLTGVVSILMYITSIDQKAQAALKETQSVVEIHKDISTIKTDINWIKQTLQERK